MAVTAHLLRLGVPIASYPTSYPGLAFYICDTEAERPTPAAGNLGDIAYTIDTDKNWRSNGTTWVSMAGAGGGGAAWGEITGTLSNQTDLQTALNGKEAANANIQAHVVSAHAPSNAQKNSDITLAEIEAKLIGVISSHSHSGGGGGVAMGVIVATGMGLNLS